MKDFCVNINASEVAYLSELNGLSNRTTAAYIGLWQRQNETDEFPSASQFKSLVEALNSPITGTVEYYNNIAQKENPDVRAYNIGLRESLVSEVTEITEDMKQQADRDSRILKYEDQYYIPTALQTPEIQTVKETIDYDTARDQLLELDNNTLNSEDLFNLLESSGLNINTLNFLKSLPEIDYNFTTNYKASSYDAKTQTININIHAILASPFTNGSTSIADTIAHEVLHRHTQALVYYAAHSQLRNKLSSDQRAAYENLHKIVESNPDLKNFGIASVGELLANLGNPEVVDFLEKSNSFKSFIKTLLAFFGIRSNDYDIAKKGMYKLISTFNPLNVHNIDLGRLGDVENSNLDELIAYKNSPIALKDLVTTVYSNKDLSSTDLMEIVAKQKDPNLRKALTSFIQETIATQSKLANQKKVLEQEVQTLKKEAQTRFMFASADRLKNTPIQSKRIVSSEHLDGVEETTDNTKTAQDVARELESVHGLLLAYTHPRDPATIDLRNKSFIYAFKQYRDAIVVPYKEVLEKHLIPILFNPSTSLKYKYRFKLLARKEPFASGNIDNEIYAEYDEGGKTYLVPLLSLYDQTETNKELSEVYHERLVHLTIDLGRSFSDVKRKLDIQQVSAGGLNRFENKTTKLSLNHLIEHFASHNTFVKFSKPHIYTDVKGMYNAEKEFPELFFPNGGLKTKSLREEYPEVNAKFEALVDKIREKYGDKYISSGGKPLINDVDSLYISEVNKLNGQPLVFYTFDPNVDFDSPSFLKTTKKTFLGKQLTNGVGILHLDAKPLPIEKLFEFDAADTSLVRSTISKKKNERVLELFQNIVRVLRLQEDCTSFMNNYTQKKTSVDFNNVASNLDATRNTEDDAYTALREFIKFIFSHENIEKVDFDINSQDNKLSVVVSNYEHPVAFLNVSKTEIYEAFKTMNPEISGPDDITVYNRFDMPLFIKLAKEYFSQFPTHKEPVLHYLNEFFRTTKQSLYLQYRLDSDTSKSVESRRTRYGKIKLGSATGEQEIYSSLFSTVESIRTPTIYYSKNKFKGLIENAMNSTEANSFSPVRRDVSRLNIISSPKIILNENDEVNNKLILLNKLNALPKGGISKISHVAVKDKIFIDLDILYLQNTVTTLEESLVSADNLLRPILLSQIEATKNLITARLKSLRTSTKSLNFNPTWADLLSGATEFELSGLRNTTVNVTRKINEPWDLKPTWSTIFTGANKKLLEETFTEFELSAISDTLETYFSAKELDLETILALPQVLNVLTPARASYLLNRYDSSGLIRVLHKISMENTYVKPEVLYAAFKELNDPNTTTVYDLLLKTGMAPEQVNSLIENTSSIETSSLFVTLSEYAESIRGYDTEVNKYINNTEYVSEILDVYLAQNPLNDYIAQRLKDHKYLDENNNPCLKLGGSIGFTPSNKWELVGQFKGASHAHGGIDIAIEGGKITIKDKSGELLQAEKGLVISKNSLI